MGDINFKSQKKFWIFYLKKKSKYMVKDLKY